MICKQCGKEISDTAKFCDECGAPVIIKSMQSLDSDSKQETSANKSYWSFIALIITVLVVVVLIQYSRNQTDKRAQELLGNYSSSSSASTGEKNALASAKLYISVMPFSYDGLIEQLKYEGYTTEEATYGAKYCGADWNEQAALKAALYLDTMAFSKSGLIDQLEYDGFTHSQAVYGVSQNGY